jgi:multiple sugar transport system permease protein
MRLAFALMYALLTLGAISMVYPFLLMLGTSVTSSADTNEFRILPRYFFDVNALFAKYVDDKYAGDIERINALYRTDFKKISDARLPANLNAPESTQLVAAWNAFRPTLPLAFQEAGFRGYGIHPSVLALSWRALMRTKFHNDIRALNRAYSEEHRFFETVMPPVERLNARNWNYDSSRKMQDFLEWKRELPPERLLVAGAEPLFARYLSDDSPRYNADIRKAAKVWKGARAFTEIVLPTDPPANPDARADWEDFVRKYLPFRYIALRPEALAPYRAYLRQRYPSLSRLNAAYKSDYASFESIPLPDALPDGGAMITDWGEFVAKVAPLAALHLDTPENRFRAYLQTAAPNLKADAPPYALADAAYVQAHTTELRRNYLTRNYSLVIDYVLLHGRALWVTIVFCLAMILTTLTVNPLCAYALSRYRLPYAYNILLFLLATMAFPGEVAMIPNFLLLKEMGLLNTYWALILPGAASGFSIFLLKGFFDSLPKELYEAGMIDGASEPRMFWQITIPLARPIFAVIALEAFTAAYGAFMFALIICQNPDMWTIMVWLYELQINNPQYVNMAALTIASVPTLLVFVFAQNVILRGIILPTEK